MIISLSQELQRRTSAPFGVSADFPKDAFRTLGMARTHARQSHTKQAFTARYHPHFGTTIYWFVEFDAGLFSIAVGCFPDPNFPCLIAPSSNGRKMTKSTCRRTRHGSAPSGSTRNHCQLIGDSKVRGAALITLAERGCT
mgnify:CR=1 FL=1